MRIYFSEDLPGKFSPPEILQNCVTSLGNFNVKYQDPWKWHDFFLYTSGNSTSFLIIPLNFHTFFHQYPWKFHILKPHPCMDFFWNSPSLGVLAKNLPKSCLKMTVSAVAKTFENLKLENYRSDTIKLAWYVYHLNTFHLLKTVGVSKYK